MTDLDERIYCSEEQFITCPDCDSGRPPESFYEDGTSSGTTYTGLGADGTTWTALGPVRGSEHAASGNQTPYFTTC